MSKSNILLESGTNELEILEFGIADSSFGINVTKVKQLLRQMPVQGMPNSHPCIEGVVKPRDDIYTVIDLAKYLGLGHEASSDKDIFILTYFNKIEMAFHVHRIESIHRFSWSEVEKPDSMIYGGNEGIVTGIVKIGDRICPILDFEKIVFDISPETGIRMSEIDELGEREMHRNAKVLVAEDSALLRKMVIEALSKAGYTNIHSVTDGQAAWEYLEDSRSGGDKKVDAVITDIEMPRMDGLRLTKLIKDDKAFKGMPVIIFSSLINEATKHKCDEVGTDATLSKPEIGNLVTTLDSVLAK